MTDLADGHESRFTSYLGWQLYLGLLLIALGVSLGLLVDHSNVWQKIAFAGITEFGFAFVIAHVIIVVVDRREKKDFSDFVKNEYRRTKSDLEIAERRLSTRAVLSHLLATDLPTSITDELEEFILSSKILKRHQKLTFELKAMGKYTALHFEAEALFENTRRETYDWHPPYTSFGEDMIAAYFLNNFPEEKFGIVTYAIFIKRSGRPDFDLVYDKTAGDPRYAQLAEHYPLNPGDQVRVMVSDRKPRFGIDNEIFTNFSFCEKMEVYLKYQDAEYEVGYRAIHPKSKVLHTEPYFEGKKLVLDIPFMPSNGILVWWKARNA